MKPEWNWMKGMTATSKLTGKQEEWTIVQDGKDDVVIVLDVEGEEE